MKPHSDVLIVGGGIIGLTSAYFLAKAGLKVTVIDRQEFGKEASWAGAGILPPGNPSRAVQPIDKLRAESVSRFADFSAELRDLTGIENGYVKCGGVEFLGEDDADCVAMWEAEGIRFRREATASSVRVPYLLPDFAQVRNPWHLRALTAACQQVGVSLRPNTPFTREQLDPNRPTLIATGAWAGQILDLPVRPVRGQIVLFRCERLPFTHILMHGKRYLVPRTDGRVLVGSTEEPEAGFVKANTPEGVEGLKEFAFEMCPALREAEVEKCWSGLRPGSPDGLPFIGPVPGVPNLFAAVGHGRAGVQLSLGTALLVRELFMGTSSGLPTDAFQLNRPTDKTSRPAFRS
ncbi:MAG: FAD-binding oxidoreductase [Fimbriiglobus sp.]|jgi:glycine oxidase|nr:FAD-binding oxidoreductase [Fimbriiglobus sp.]